MAMKQNPKIISMKKIVLKSFCLVLLISVFSCQLVLAQKQAITIAGSTTIMPLSEKWAKTFKNKTGINVNVHGGGSTGGINAAKIGTADIGASSRELNENEKTELKPIVIGKDALVIIVNKSNIVGDISLDQARGIFIRRIKNWNELGGPNKPIQIINRESGSGTRGLFEEVIMQIMLKDKTRKIVPMSLDSIVNNSNAEVKESVKLIPNSIGYVSVGYIDNSVKVLNVDSIAPTQNNITSGKYRLIRNLYYLVKDDRDEKIKSFLGYVLSKEGQSLIMQEGFLSVLSLK